MSVKHLTALLSNEEKVKGIKLCIFMGFSALLDVIGVASIMPFIAVTSNTDLIQTNSFISLLYQLLLFENTSYFLVFLGGLFFTLLCLAQAAKAAVTFQQTKFVAMLEYRITSDILDNYLKKPFIWMVKQESSELTKTLLSEVGAVVGGAVMPALAVVSSTFTAIALFVLLCAVDIEISVISFAAFGISFGLIYKYNRTVITKIGNERLNSNGKRYASVTECFSAFREIKMHDLKDDYVRQFREDALKYASSQQRSSIISQIPRFAMELITFGGVVLTLLYLIIGGENLIDFLPLLSVFALSAYRLMPAIQIIYGNAVQLNFTTPSLLNLVDRLSELKKSEEDNNLNSPLVCKNNDGIVFDKVSFFYDKDSEPVIKDLSLTISNGTKLGIIGESGSGKTTLLDLIAGLIYPTGGTISFNGTKIEPKNAKKWRKLVGYTSQSPFLLTGTVLDNIVFGNQKKIESAQDLDKIRNAASLAGLTDFIDSKQHRGLDTYVGEGGRLLSGGQRQRLVIARALFNDQTVLIFDEATSALDDHNEATVLNSISSVKNDSIVIIISHDLDALRYCDRVLCLEDGQICFDGTFNQSKDFFIKKRKPDKN